MIEPTRRTQPYRKPGGRPQTAALVAMLSGQPTFLPNPMDLQRATLLLAAARRRGRR